MFLVLKGVYSFSVSFIHLLMVKLNLNNWVKEFSVSFIHLLMVKLSLNNWVKESYVIDTILFG